MWQVERTTDAIPLLTSYRCNHWTFVENVPFVLINHILISHIKD